MITHLSDDEFDKLVESGRQRKADRAAKMPDEKAAISQMFEAYQRLQELGWREAIYCPKDGSMFSAITAGSTGVHLCNYEGEWPKGAWWIYDGDVWPARPILFRERRDDDPVVNRGLAMEYRCDGRARK